MCCFQAANSSNSQRKIPELVLVFLERQVVLLDPTKCVQTAADCSEGLAVMPRNFLSSAQVAKKVCWENAFPNTPVTCAMHIKSLEILCSTLVVSFQECFSRQLYWRVLVVVSFLFLKRPVLEYFKNLPFFLMGIFKWGKKKALVIKTIISLLDMHFMDSYLHYVSRTICKK